MDLLCGNNSNGQLPQSYLDAPKNKRHPIHRKKNIAGGNADVSMTDLASRADIPPEVKKVLQDMEQEEVYEPLPDEQQLQILEDIWLKADEMDVNEASVYDDGYNKKKNRKRKKKQQNAADKSVKKKSRAKKNTNKIQINDSEGEIKSREIMNMIEASVPCIVLTNLKGKNPEILDQSRRSDDSNIDDTIESVVNDNEIRDANDEVVETPEKAPKQKRKHPKHSECKKHKQKHSCKGKHRGDIPTLSINEPLDISDIDVQRKLTAMPSLKVSNMKDMSLGQSKVNSLPGKIISVGNEFSMTSMRNKTVVNITNGGQPQTSSPFTERNLDMAIARYGEDLNKLVEQRENLDILESGTLESERLESIPNLTTARMKLTSGNQQQFITKSNATPISTYSNLTKPPRNSARKSIIKAAKLMPNILKNSEAKRQRPTLTAEVTKAEEETDISNAVDGLLVLQQNSWEAAQKNCKLNATSLGSFSMGNINRDMPPVLSPQTSVSVVKGQSLLLDRSSLVPCVTLIKKEVKDYSRLAPVKIEESTSNERTCALMESKKSPKHTTPSIIERYVTGGKLLTSVQRGTKIIQMPNGQKMFVPDREEPRVPTDFKCQPPVLQIQTNIQSSVNCAGLNPPVLSCSETGKNTTMSPIAAANSLIKFKTEDNEPTVNCNQNSITIKLINNPEAKSCPRDDDPRSSYDESSETSIRNILQSYNSMNRQQKNVIAAKEDLEPLTSERCMQSMSEKLDSDLELCKSEESKSQSHSRLAGTTESQMVGKCRKKTPKKERKQSLQKNNTPEASVAVDEQCNGDSSLNSEPVIPGHIMEMLYPNVADVNLLKAFNDYWSTEISHCAICAAFASTNSGRGKPMTSDWKYCKPTDLPESSPIWVSSSLFAANSKEQGTEPEKNKLLSCRECHVTVHASCYGINVLPTDQQSWACDKCRAGMVCVVSIQSPNPSVKTGTIFHLFHFRCVVCVRCKAEPLREQATGIGLIYYAPFYCQALCSKIL